MGYRETPTPLELGRAELAATLGKAVRTRRTELGYSAETLGRMLDDGYRWIYRLERGEALPSTPRFLRLVERLGLNFDAALGWNASPTTGGPAIDIEELPAALGAALSPVIAALDIHTADLAERLGVSTSYCRRLVGGYESPSLLLLARIVEEFGLCADALLRVPADAMPAVSPAEGAAA